MVATLFASTSCSDYLDVIPDNLPTIDHAFTNRTNAEKYLFTCYLFTPSMGSLYKNPGFFAGNELWTYEMLLNHPNVTAVNAWRIARGDQNANDPFLNYFEGGQQGHSVWKGIRACNIFLENIDKPKDITDFERKRWAAEVKFLKAYMHYWLLRMYGPIPIVDKNLPISATPEEVKYQRRPIDECVKYIDDLMLEAAKDLPLKIENAVEEMGRVTQPAALAIRAEMLVMAASPLFNGNEQYANFANIDGTKLFPPLDPQKWNRAAEACKAAIDTCKKAGIRLYKFTEPGLITSSTRLKMSIRGSVSERWNNELIWGTTNPIAAFIQSASQAYLDGGMNVGGHIELFVAPTMGTAKQFYTSNGVPIEQDRDWQGVDPMAPTTVPATPDGEEKQYYMQEGYRTVKLHLNREPRFYATLGFDGSYWYGQGKLTESEGWVVNALGGQSAGQRVPERYSVTGYFAKKLVNYRNTMRPPSTYAIYAYAFPVIRLADLYLLYAEALNEANGPSPEVFEYIDEVRARAGLKGVEASWRDHSNQPSLPTSKQGLRQIIHTERLIELACEGKAYWDIRRWKQAEAKFNGPILGWNTAGQTPEDYYKPTPIFNQKFTPRDYLWPIKQTTLSINGNMVQAPGW